MDSRKPMDDLRIEDVYERITLISETSAPNFQSVEELFLGEDIVACDFTFADIDQAELRPYGYERGRIRNVDHHGPAPEWERPISSGNLAVRYIREHGTVRRAVINHTDCDSILSAAIVTGLLPPSLEYEEAVIAADHSGAENPIADLLQAIQDRRSISESLDCLSRLESGQPLESWADALVLARQNSRRAAAAALVSGWREGNLLCLNLPAKIESELVGGLVPDAWAVAMAFPSAELPGRTELKLRLCPSAPDGFTLRWVDLAFVDPGYGGRWNAGSNRRGGGSLLSPEELLERVATAFSVAVARFALGHP